MFDVGMGVNVIYLFIGNYEYGWYFIGFDIDVLFVKIVK